MRDLVSGSRRVKDKHKKKKVIFYPGCTAEFWNPNIGKAGVRVLEKNGFQVIIPEHQCCNVAKIAYGNLEAARKGAKKLIDILYSAAEPDYNIVTACPSCSLAIKEDYLHLLDNKKTQLVSERTYFFSQYLNKLDEKKELNKEFKKLSLSVAYHSPCHLKAQKLDSESVKLLNLIPGISVIELDRGCCGMAGTAGFKRRYYNSSMEIGSELFKRIRELDVQVLATDCAGCEMQMEQGSGVEVVHPITILDQAYL